MGDLKLNRPNHISGVKYPGKMAFASERGHFSGCTALEFTSVEKMNAFFADDENMDLMVIEIIPFQGTVSRGYLCIVTKTLEDEELNYIREYGERLESGLREWRAERNKAREEQEERERKHNEEQEKLAAIGKKCQDNHAPLYEEMRKIRKALKKAGVTKEQLEQLTPELAKEDEETKE